MSFGIYIAGYVIFIAGVAIGAHLLNAPLQWIGVGVLCLIGLAIVFGVKATQVLGMKAAQQRAPPP